MIFYFIEMMLRYGIENKQKFQMRHIFQQASFTKHEKTIILSDTYALFNFNHGIRFSNNYPNHVIIRLHNQGVKYMYQVIDLRKHHFIY